MINIRPLHNQDAHRQHQHTHQDHTRKAKQSQTRLKLCLGELKNKEKGEKAGRGQGNKLFFVCVDIICSHFQYFSANLKAKCRCHGEIG